jgi:tetratricopeptide (TPR) repeat protein
VSQTPFFAGPVIDSETYLALARHIARTGDFGGAFYQPPLYPTFLALLELLGFASAWQIAFVQCVLGSATAVLLVAIGRRLASDDKHARAVGLVCGLSSALYGPFVLFDVDVLPSSCVSLLLATALWLGLRPGKVGIADGALGSSLGLGIVAWPLLCVFVPVLLALRLRAVPGRLALLTLVVVAAASAPVALTARHNARHEAAGVLVSHNLGINLWLGNNPAWRDTWRARPGAAFEPELERPDREGVTRPGARSDFFVRLVLRDALARPGPAVSRTAQKLFYLWSGPEIRRDQDIELMREASPVLRVLQWRAGVAFPFGVVAPLALLALWRRRSEPVVRCLALGVLAYSLLLALFFVSARYRLPLVLVLLPFAADQALVLFRDRGKLVVAAAVLAVALNLRGDFQRTFDATPAERSLLRARAFRNGGDLTQASRQAASLLARFDNEPDVHMFQAELLVARGDCEEAESHLRQVIELAPRTVTPRLMLADCLIELGRLRPAERELASALALHPFHAIALKQAASLYLRERRPRDARVLLNRFLASGYRDPEVSSWVERLP